MPFQYPTLERLKKLAQSTIVASLSEGGVVKRRRVEDALGAAVGAVQYLGIERLLVMWRQLWPDTATGRWLDRHGEIWDVPRKDRERASGKIRVTGVDGTVLPAGSEFENDDGSKFTTDEEVEISGGEAFVLVTASVAGATSNTPSGAELTLTVGVPGIDDTATVVLGENGENGIVGGLDLEENEDYRARILRRISEPPQGGSEEDYIQWALEVSGITRAWAVGKHSGPGTVLVLVVDDNSNPITPTQSKLDEVQAYLETVAPVTDYITTAAPTLLKIDIELTLSPNTSEVQAAVTTALQEFFRRREIGANAPKVHLSQMIAAIDSALGEDWHELTDPASSPDVALYEIPTLGALTFNDP